jgi:hypothetical protein
MPLSLGPMPPGLQELVERWIKDGRGANTPTNDPVCEALFICGGPGACCYLKASGDVLRWDMWDDVVTTMDDVPTR